MTRYEEDVPPGTYRQSQFKAKMSPEMAARTDELRKTAKSFDDIDEEFIVRALLDIYRNATRPTVQRQAIYDIMTAKGLTNTSGSKPRESEPTEDLLERLGRGERPRRAI